MTFLFSYVTHNKKFGVRATRDNVSLTSPVTLTITTMETGNSCSQTCKSEKAARKVWLTLHRANLK